MQRILQLPFRQSRIGRQRRMVEGVNMHNIHAAKIHFFIKTENYIVYDTTCKIQKNFVNNG